MNYKSYLNTYQEGKVNEFNGFNHKSSFMLNIPSFLNAEIFLFF